jgi:hypothetical protein
MFFSFHVQIFYTVYSVRNKYFNIFGVGIDIMQFMTFDNVDTMIYQPLNRMF